MPVDAEKPLERVLGGYTRKSWPRGIANSIAVQDSFPSFPGFKRGSMSLLALTFTLLTCGSTAVL